LHENRRVMRWHGARLPGWAHEWAAEAARDLPEDFYVLHPYSFQSTTLAMHWPYWQIAINSLLHYTGATYVLTGAGWHSQGEHPRLVNLLGKAPSMLAVMALAQRSKGIIGTCNSLAHWAVIQNIPAVICGHSEFAKTFFRKWIDVENICYIDYPHPKVALAPMQVPASVMKANGATGMFAVTANGNSFAEQAGSIGEFLKAIELFG